MSKVADTFRQPLVLIQTPECYSLCYWVDKGWKKSEKADSWTSTNSHLSTTATIFCPAGQSIY